MEVDGETFVGDVEVARAFLHRIPQHGPEMHGLASSCEPEVNRDTFLAPDDCADMGRTEAINHVRGMFHQPVLGNVERVTTDGELTAQGVGEIGEGGHE